ncbi:hypothetical protein SCLCIDRAFT_24187 [Scleroderma citrinum Foug A]|uniref:Uncharacterized protein n=1 Tax=Scleroderma citrinum Foug A TaxID=1036808 RepID=A0A0C3E4Z4_9AGAM|nr:hypothetical protein SCLCIDRAFT_24187 [Scleroderma citrinum Foug A]
MLGIATREHAKKVNFRNFRRQLFHTSLGQILKTFKPAMLKPEVTVFGDGHYWRVIYGFGPYIADYEEQALLACIVCNWCPRCLTFRNNLDDDNALHRCCDHTEALIENFPLDRLWHEYGIVGELVPFTNDFPHANIYELIAPDLLHQIIKGTFKDHLVEWVYLPAIEGHLPQEVISTFRAFLKFCYTVRQNVLTAKDLDYLNEVLTRFHWHREFFKTTGVVTTFSLPRQHSMKHYKQLIQLFGAPNGLCSSITESKHVKAVKKPYRRTSKYCALGQMLIINQRLDKLAASCIDFKSRGMLEGTCLSMVVETLTQEQPAEGNHQANEDDPHQQLSASIDDVQDDCEDVDGRKVEAHVQRNRARTVVALTDELNIPNLPELVRQFLCGQLYPDAHDPTTISHLECPGYHGNISIYNSASSTFYAPSDLSGVSGMRREYIRATPAWRQDGPRYDCVFIITDPELEGMHGMDVARVLCFFAFKTQGKQYPCAVVRWFDCIGDMPDETTGMWMVRPSFIWGQQPNFAVIHVDAIFHATHLIPIFGRELVPPEIKPYHCYDIYHGFYVNKFADHHAFEVTF